VDNRLLDNDRVIADLESHLESEVGATARSIIGASSSNCEPSLVTRITWALCNAIATHIRAIWRSSPSAGSCSTIHLPTVFSLAHQRLSNA